MKDEIREEAELFIDFMKNGCNIKLTEKQEKAIRGYLIAFFSRGVKSGSR